MRLQVLDPSITDLPIHKSRRFYLELTKHGELALVHMLIS